jgi:hypothetical protein
LRHSVRAVLLGLALTITSSAWAQWSSDPTQNLVLSNMLNADQVQPKTAALPNNAWYVSWFNNNGVIPNSGYNVYYQLLSASGVQQFPQNGIQVANETGLSSTQDYGLAIDGDGNALLAFQDLRRDPNNPQITVAKMSPTGEALWGPLGIALTFGNLNSNNAPKVTVTTDGYIVVGWTSNNQTVLQKLTPSGSPVWVGATAFNYGVVLQQSEYYYSLADLHAGDNGSVVVSFVANQGFGSNSYLYANKISPSGQLLWGSGNVHVFDGGSLQFGEFPYFVHLLRNHPDRPQPRLHQLRPSRYRKLRAPQSKCMPALRIQMHLHGNPSVLQRNVVSQRVVYIVHVVILACSKNVGGVWRVTGISGFNPKIFIGSRRIESQTFWCLALHPTPPRTATDAPDK